MKSLIMILNWKMQNNELSFSHIQHVGIFVLARVVV